MVGVPHGDAARPRLLYVEDDTEIATMSTEVLQEQYDVEHVGDLASARRRVLAARFDVIVVDRRLPDGDGVDLVVTLRTARITTPVLMLTALDAVRDRVEGLDAGANDYLAKPFDFDELLARLRALRRAFSADGDRRQLGGWVFVQASDALYAPDGRRIALTSTESAVIALLAESPEHVFSRDEILHAALRGDSIGSVDAAVHYVRRKSAPELIETVRGHGYRIGAP